MVDDEPVRWGDFVGTLAQAISAPPPRTLPGWLLALAPYGAAIMTSTLRVSNAKANADFGWEPTVATYRDGIARIASTLTAPSPQPHERPPPASASNAEGAPLDQFPDRLRASLDRGLSGVMLGICPEATIVVISHQITRYSIAEGARTLAVTLPSMPVGTHVGVVDPGVAPTGGPW